MGRLSSKGVDPVKPRRVVVVAPLAPGSGGTDPTTSFACAHQVFIFCLFLDFLFDSRGPASHDTAPNEMTGE
jgi:hypothetical protein